MKIFRLIAVAAVLAWWPHNLAIAQTGVVFIPPVTPGDCVTWSAPNIIKDAGYTCDNVAPAPAGSTTQLQYNNSGAYGGISGVTTDGTALTIASGDLKLSGASSGTSILNAPSTGGGTLTLPAGTTTLAGLGTVQTWTAVQSFADGDLSLLGSGSGNSIIKAPATGGGTATLPAGTGTLAYSSSIPALPLTPANGGTGVANSGNLTWNAAQTFIFTSAQTMTFPAATDTLAGLGTAQTFTGVNTYAPTAAASPTALSWAAQSVVAGTSNTAGVAWTFKGSQSTGTGAGGSIIFQIAPAGTTGTAQNSLSTVLTLDPAYNVAFRGALFAGGSVASWTRRVGNNPSSSTVVFEGEGATASGVRFQYPPNGMVLPGVEYYGFANSIAADGSTSPDALMTRRAAANINFGAVDAAAPVAQTLSVQSVVAGTTNTAGASWTLKGSAGTGTGIGGNIVFQTAITGTTGSTQNTFSTAFTIDTNQLLIVGASFTVANLPAAAAGNKGARTFITDGAAVPVFGATVTGAGSLFLPVFSDGTNWRNG